MCNVQSWDWSEGVSARHYWIDEQTVHWEHEKLLASVDWLTDSIADRAPLLRGLLLINMQSYHLHCFWAPVIDVPFTALWIQVCWTQASSVSTTNNKQVCTTTKAASAQTVQQHSWWYSEYTIRKYTIIRMPICLPITGLPFIHRYSSNIHM